jgi:hypothetical protein
MYEHTGKDIKMDLKRSRLERCVLYYSDSECVQVVGCYEHGHELLCSISVENILTS